MRAVLCRAWGEVEDLRLGDAPPPIPADGEVLIAVKATGINYADALMVAGKLPDEAAAAVQPRPRGGGDRRRLRRRRDALQAGRPRDGDPGPRRPRRARGRSRGGNLRHSRRHELRGGRRLSGRLHLEPRRAALAGPARARRDAAGAGRGGRRGAHRRRDRQGHGRARDRRGQHGREARGGAGARGGRRSSTTRRRSSPTA